MTTTIALEPAPPAPGPALLPILLPTLGSVVVAILAAVLATYLSRRREPDQWFWQKRMEAYEAVLAKARFLLRDVDAREMDPRVEEARPLPDDGEDEQVLTARLGMYGSEAMREQWSTFVAKWEEHLRLSTSGLSPSDRKPGQAHLDSTSVLRAISAGEELERMYADLLVAAQKDARNRPARPKGRALPTEREIKVGHYGPASVRNGARVVDEEGTSVAIKRKSAAPRVRRRDSVNAR